LFVIAYFLDRTDAMKKIMALNKPVEYNVGGKKVALLSSEIIAAVVFIAMGLMTIYLSMTNQLAQNSGFKISTNVMLANVSSIAAQYFSGVPGYAVAGTVLLAFAVLAFIAFKRQKLREKGASI